MSSSSLNFTSGCDPEFFLQEDKTGKVVSAIGKINGTKDQPIVAPNGAELHYDNILFEMALPISTSKEEWMHINETSLRLASSMLPNGYSLAMNLSSLSVSESELEHPDAKVFGCSRDFSAWTLKVNESPVCDDPSFRCGGGHIHVGHLALEGISNKITMTRLMDALHGLISCELDDNDGSEERRKLYGKAGCYRPTEYGIEYRTLSNYWMKSEDTQELMYLLTRDALHMLVDDSYTSFFNMFKEERVDIQKTIDSNESCHLLWIDEYRMWLGDDTVDLLEECLFNVAEEKSLKYLQEKQDAENSHMVAYS